MAIVLFSVHWEHWVKMADGQGGVGGGGRGGRGEREREFSKGGRWFMDSLFLQVFL